MQTVTKNISELIPNDQNVRIHNTNQVKELIKSINQFGIIRPIVVDENNVILCGHGLWQALKEMGKETAECKVTSGLTEKQKKKLMLADNKIYSLGTDNYDLLDSILAEFGADKDFEIPGFNSEVLEDLYGIKSIENESKQTKTPTDIKEDIKEFEMPIRHQENKNNDVKEEKIPAPSARMQEAREEALKRKVIICPHCGGTIEV